MQKLILLTGAILLFFTGSILADGYVKPDQWGGYNGKDYETGNNVTVRPDNYGGYKVKNGNRTIDMKPNKYGGYQCNEYDRNNKKIGSYYLEPDGYGGYTSDKKGVRVKKDKWGVYKW